MPTSIGIGFSQDGSAAQAAQQAAQQAQEQLQSDKIDLAIVFNTIHYSPLETLLTVRKTLATDRLIGSSTAGVILSELVSLRGVGVLAISSDELHFGTGSIANLSSQDGRQAGIALTRSILNDFGQYRRNLMLFFMDGLMAENAAFVKGMQEMMGNVFPVVGAGSSDDFHFRKTWQYHQDKFANDSAVGLMLGGNFRCAVGFQHGWKPLGKPRFITEASGNIIKSIDQKKAVAIYEDFFGAQQQLPTTLIDQLAILYPLGIALPEERHYLIKNPIGVGSDGSLTCQGEIPEDSEVHIMISNKDACRQAAILAAQQVKEQLGDREPKLLLIFESLGRHKLLGRSAHQEIQAIKNILGYEVPIFGMYCHGEVAPMINADNTRKVLLQNKSIVILGIG